MTTNTMDNDVLSIDGEIDRIGTSGAGNGFYMVNLPRTVARLKVAKACQMELVVIPYKTTQSPRVAPGKMYFFRDYFKYYKLGPTGKDTYFDCVQTFGEKCPIGDAMAAAGVKSKAQRIGLFNVFVLSIDDLPVNKPYVIDFSYANFAQKLFEASNAKKKRRGQEHAATFADPRMGSVIQFAWKEEVMPSTGAKYYVADTFDFVKHEGLDGQVAKSMAEAVDLDAALNKLPYAEAKARFIDCVAETTVRMELKSEVKSPPKTEVKNQPKDVSPPQETVAAPAAAESDAPYDAGWE